MRVTVVQAMVSRAKKFIHNAIMDIRSCPQFTHKLAIVVSSAGRAMTLLVNASSVKLLGMERDLVPNNLFLFWDVYVVNKDGAFFCRKMTSDYSVLRSDYELALRDYFEVDEGVFLDVGAHIGKYTVMVGRRLGKKGKVIAVEPDQDNFQALEANIRENQLQNVIALNVACAKTNGPVTLYRDPCEPIKHSLQKGPGSRVTVDARSIDSLK